jgi:dynamin family protein
VTYSGNVTGQIEGIRQKTVTVLDELIARAGEFELAEPSPALGRYRQKLNENAYKVLVVGEAKRGKSTFVNALIGRDILPTDVDVATSQVFNVRPSEQEAYRLRFEDGSEREIPPEDLPLYGSQRVANTGFLPTSDRVICCIEVKDAKVKVEVKKEEPAIILLRKYIDGLSMLRGAGELDRAARSSNEFLGQKPLIWGISYLFGRKLCTQPLRKFRNVFFGGIRFLRFPYMVIVGTSDVKS